MSHHSTRTSLRILSLVTGLCLSAAAALAQPVTTREYLTNGVTPCSANTPIVGNGAGNQAICASGTVLLNGGALGTPSSGTLTNATGLPISTGVSGMGTGVATALGTNVGSAGAPVVNGGALGTPSSGTLTNATGLPTTALTGTLQAAQEPAHTGDCTNSAGSLALSCISKSLVFLGAATASNSASLSFTGLAGSSYSEFYLVVDAIVPVTNATNLRVQISTSAGFLASGYRHGVFRWTSAATGVSGSTSDTGWIINSTGETLGTGANQSVSFSVHIYGTDNITPLKRANWTGSGLYASGSYVFLSGGGEVDTNSAAIDGVRLLLDSGNISSGTVRLYGVKNS